MKFYEFGDKHLPHVMLIHGAGWSYWLYLREAEMLSDRYHVILPVIDGHGEENHLPYVSTEAAADKLMDYIDTHCDGKLFALSGVSMGGQIAIELLSRRKNLAEKAIIESGLCIPQPQLLKLSLSIYKLVGSWMFSKGFNTWALKLMPKSMKLPQEIETLYLRDMCVMKSETMNQIFNTYYRYELKENLKDCEADTQYWYGGKEMRCIQESAHHFKSYVPKCQIVELKGYRHSEISAYHPEEWVEKATAFWIK